MAGVNRGLAYMREQREKLGNREDSMWQLFPPREGEHPEFWFLNDGDSMNTVLMHGVKIPRKGDRGGTWTKDVICSRESFEEDREKCPMCAKKLAGDETITGPFLRTGTLVYLTRTLYNEKPAKGDAKPVRRQRGEGFYYVQDNGDVRIFLMKDKMANQAADIHFGTTSDDLFSEGLEEAAAPAGPQVENLMDQPFTIDATGEKASKLEILKPLAKREVPAEVVAARDGADELVLQIMTDKFGQGQYKAPTIEGDGRQASDPDIGPVEGPDGELIPEGWDPGEPADEDLVSF